MLWILPYLLLVFKKLVQLFLAVFANIVALVIDNLVHAATENAGRFILLQNDFVVVVDVDFERILFIDV
jgi:hypothetical protein